MTLDILNSKFRPEENLCTYDDKIKVEDNIEPQTNADQNIPITLDINSLKSKKYLPYELVKIEQQLRRKINFLEKIKIDETVKKRNLDKNNVESDWLKSSFSFTAEFQHLFSDEKNTSQTDAANAESEENCGELSIHIKMLNKVRKKSRTRKLILFC